MITHTRYLEAKKAEKVLSDEIAACRDNNMRAALKNKRAGSRALITKYERHTDGKETSAPATAEKAKTQNVTHMSFADEQAQKAPAFRGNTYFTVLYVAKS